MQEVKTHDIKSIVFLNAGLIDTGGQFGEKIIFKVETDTGSEYEYTISKTSLSNLAEAWGTETNNWVERKATLTIEEQTWNAEAKSILIAKPTDEKKEVKEVPKTEDSEIPVIEDKPKDKVDVSSVPF